METKLPNFFWIGPQKSASTWAYTCFREHPEIFVPDEDEIHYYDINYHKGSAWYERFYNSAEDESVVGDTTSSYIRSPKAPQRVADDVTDAKIIACLRNPIDRAFSHHWHEKKKGKINFEFEEALENYDLFQSWIETGFYSMHLKRYFQHFDRENIMVILLDDIKKDDEKVIKQVFDFLEVDDEFSPSVVGEKVNTSGFENNWKKKILNNGLNVADKLGFKDTLLQSDTEFVKYLKNQAKKFMDKSEYKKGVTDNVRRELVDIYKKDIDSLEGVIGKDLSHWLK